MATEQTDNFANRNLSVNPAAVARDQAINELRLAILSLQCGEVQSAINHAKCAADWSAEIQ